MKKLFKILGILSVVFAAAGAGVILAGVCMGGSLEIIWQHSDSKDKPEGDAIDNTEHIKKLCIEMTAGEMVIEQGKYESVMVAADDSKMKTDIKVNGDELQIKGRGKWKNHGDEIRIYLPDDLKLEQFDLSVGAGRVTADRLAADEVSIEVGAGEFSCSDFLQAEQLGCEVGAGEIVIEQAQSEETNLECSLGNIDITMTGAMQDYDLNGDCAFGELAYDGIEWNFHDDIRAGSQNSGNVINAHCSFGNIEIEFDK